MTSIKIAQLMQQSGVTFGTSGARGLVENMTDEVCQAYTLGFLSVIRESFTFSRVALGIDLRPSSPAIAAACISAIRHLGINVDYCGALPTPALAYYAQTHQIPAIMVTGSHIPFDRNGIKFYRPDGEISKRDELAIAETEIDVVLPLVTAALPPITSAAVQQYQQRYVDFFPAQVLSGMRIGLYEHSSVARDMLRELLIQLGAEVIGIGRTDKFVPIDTEAVSEEDRQRGLDWAKQYAVDALLSTDGDADRPLIADEQGRWLRGDIVGLLTSRYLGIEQLVLPISCNTAIEACGWFKRVIRTRIGSPYVIESMQALNISDGPIAGFEANGGYLLGSTISQGVQTLVPLPTRDAVLPMLTLLVAARQQGQAISTLLEPLPKRYTASDRLRNFPVALGQQLFAKWTLDAEQITRWLELECGVLQSLELTDGLRFIFVSDEIVHLRASGNAPELRCYCEAASVERAQFLVAKTLAKLVDIAQKALRDDFG